jgi:hypothetical protein
MSEVDAETRRHGDSATTRCDDAIAVFQSLPIAASDPGIFS